MFDRDRFDDDDDWFDLERNQQYLALCLLGVFVSISNGSELSHERALLSADASRNISRYDSSLSLTLTMTMTLISVLSMNVFQLLKSIWFSSKTIPTPSTRRDAADTWRQLLGCLLLVACRAAAPPSPCTSR